MSLPCLPWPSMVGSSPRLLGGSAGWRASPLVKGVCGHTWIPRVLTNIAIFSVQSPSCCAQKAKHSWTEFHPARRCGWASSDAPGDAAPIHPHRQNTSRRCSGRKNKREKGCLWCLLCTQTDPESNSSGFSAELGTKGAVELGWALQQQQSFPQLRAQVGTVVLPACAGSGPWQPWPCSTRMLLGCSWPSLVLSGQGGKCKDRNVQEQGCVLFTGSVGPVFNPSCWGLNFSKKRKDEGIQLQQGFCFQYGLLLVSAVPHQLARCIKGSISPILNRSSEGQKEIWGGCGKLCFSPVSYSRLFSKGLKGVFLQSAAQKISHLCVQPSSCLFHWDAVKLPI